MSNEIEHKDWRSMDYPERCQHARELERRSIKLSIDGDNDTAEEVRQLAEDIYWSMVNEEFEGSFPYERLAIMYRNQDPDKEVEVLELGMKQMKLSTEKKRQKFEDRLERARELQRQTNG